MKSLLVRRFFTAHMLNELSNSSLRELFTPVAGEIEEAFSVLLIPEDAEQRRQYCERLADLVANADEGFNKTFQMELDRVMRLSQMSDLGDIVAKAAEHTNPHPFEADAEATATELAIKLWRWNPEFTDRQIAGRPPKPKSYFVYQARSATPPVFKNPDAATKSCIEEALKKWFKKASRGDSCQLQVRELEDEVVFVVGHGDLNKIVELLRGGIVVRDIQRHYDYDLIVFRKDTGTLLLYLRRTLKRLMDEYLKQISERISTKKIFSVKRILISRPCCATTHKLFCDRLFHKSGALN